MTEGVTPASDVILFSFDRLSTREVADLVGLKVDTIRAYVSRGLFPQPDGWLDRTPWWYQRTAEVWQQTQRRAPGRPRSRPSSGACNG